MYMYFDIDSLSIYSGYWNVLRIIMSKFRAYNRLESFVFILTSTMCLNITIKFTIRIQDLFFFDRKYLNLIEYVYRTTTIYWALVVDEVGNRRHVVSLSFLHHVHAFHVVRIVFVIYFVQEFRLKLLGRESRPRIRSSNVVNRLAAFPPSSLNVENNDKSITFVSHLKTVTCIIVAASFAVFNDRPRLSMNSSNLAWSLVTVSRVHVL